MIRGSYRVPGPGGAAICHWDDPLGTGIKMWVVARLRTRERNWPAGSHAEVHAEPYGERCEPVGGFARAVRPTLIVLTLAALACLGGLALLWRRKAPVG